MNTNANGISVKIPEKVYFSNNPAKYTVKNNFYFTIIKTDSDCAERTKAVKNKGEEYPAIYIKGFEQLFEDDETRTNKLDAFFKMFNTNGNKDWSISYGKFRDTDEYCAVITCTADSLNTDFSIGLQLSDKCAFTLIPDTASPITLKVYIDDFDYFFSDLSDRISYQISLERGFAVYIEKFGAYLSEDYETPVTAVPKGDFCSISWKIEQNEKASAFLYDENGAIVANLPPYTTKIDKDKKFTLVAYNDFCSVTQSLTVYRTLWKQKEAVLDGFPETDSKGRFKFYKSYNGIYYLYIHPKLYSSSDLIKWSLYSENEDAPQNYNFYSSAFSEDRFSICYLNDKTVTYYEFNFNNKKWKKYEIMRDGISFAHTMYLENNKTVIVLCTEEDVGYFELIGGELMNGRYLTLPKNTKVKAADVLSVNGQRYIAILCDNQRVYFYDLKDDYKNNIFECPHITGDNIYLVKSNAVYIVLNGYMFEVSDREKFTDIHFFPKMKEGSHPVIGGADNETVVGLFQADQNMNMWEYKF